MDTNKFITKVKKLISLQCLREVIPNHVKNGTEFHRFMLLRYPISDKIISDIDIFFIFFLIVYHYFLV